MDDSPSARLERARTSLIGLSVGDAFGQLFFDCEPLRQFTITGHKPSIDELPEPPWYWTDDTSMALSIYDNLLTYERIEQDQLAMSFGTQYVRRNGYGYGPAMHSLLPRYAMGANWQTESPKLFSGMGSFGNGSAMRVAPVGAYFADSLLAAAEAAEKSAVVTHAHEEAVAGAVAVAVAAALACRYVDREKPPRHEFIDEVIDYVPLSEVRIGLAKARDAYPGLTVYTAAQMLGNGSELTCMDTVPFVLFSAAEFLDDYEKAIWQTASVMGDVDTTCAMVGGIVACCTGADVIPTGWITHREKLPGIDNYDEDETD